MSEHDESLDLVPSREVHRVGDGLITLRTGIAADQLREAMLRLNASAATVFFQTAWEDLGLQATVDKLNEVIADLHDTEAEARARSRADLEQQRRKLRRKSAWNPVRQAFEPPHKVRRYHPRKG